MSTIEELRDWFAAYEDADWSLNVRPPDHRAPDLIHAEILYRGEVVGSTKRRVIDNGLQAIYVIHEQLELVKVVRGKGFASKFVCRSHKEYRAFGISHVEITAMKAGGYVWARHGGFEFDLSRYRGFSAELGARTECEQRAAAVIQLMESDGHLIGRSAAYGEERGASPLDVLRRLASTCDDAREAVETFVSRIPTRDMLTSRRLEGTFASPGEIAAFDSSPESRGIAVARQVLCAAGWFGRKDF